MKYEKIEFAKQLQAHKNFFLAQLEKINNCCKCKYIVTSAQVLTFPRCECGFCLGDFQNSFNFLAENFIEIQHDEEIVRKIFKVEKLMKNTYAKLATTMFLPHTSNT